MPRLVFLCCALLTSTARLAAAAGADDAEQQALRRGEIRVAARPSAAGAPEVTVRAVIDAPPGKVWALVSDCRRYPQTMPRIRAAQELSRRGNQVVCRVTVAMPFPYADLTATTRVVHENGPVRFSRRWELIEGDYTINRGSWELAPLAGDPNRTLVVYRVQALPKAWIPAWIRDRAQQSSLPEMIRQLRRQTAR